MIWDLNFSYNRIFKNGVSWLLGPLWNLNKGGKGARILLYHSVGKQEKRDTLGLRVSEESFARQMKHLADNSFNVVSLPALVENIKQGVPVVKGTVAITFDDGFRDNLEKAMPIAARHGFPVSMFVNCVSSSQDLIGVKPDYWSNWSYLSMNEIKLLADKGITIGSHSFSHRILDGSQEDIFQAIQTSKETLEREIGQAVSLFSYPHGIFSKMAKQAVRETGFLGACSSIIGCNDMESDVFELRRTEISGFDSLEMFKRKLAGHYDWLCVFHRSRFYIR
jgi:peptidoglycan/xylan/chitin deacetylase (PgdA/CDA1 family)